MLCTRFPNAEFETANFIGKWDQFVEKTEIFRDDILSKNLGNQERSVTNKNKF